MTSTSETVTRPRLLEKAKPTKEKVVAAVLGSVAAIGTIGQYSDYYWGYGMQVPDMVEAAMNSSGHPFVGFMGAMIGVKVAQRLQKNHRNSQPRTVAPVIGAAIANFYVESAQVVVRHPVEENIFWNTPRETIKDYLFALGGAGLYLAINKRKNQA